MGKFVKLAILRIRHDRGSTQLPAGTPLIPEAQAVITRVKQAEIAVRAVRAANPKRDPFAGVDGLVIITLPGTPFSAKNPKAAQPGQPANLNIVFDGGASSYEGFRIASIPVIPSTHRDQIV